MQDRVHVLARPPFVYALGLVFTIWLTKVYPDYQRFEGVYFLFIISTLSLIFGLSTASWGWQSLTDRNVDPNFKPVGTFVVRGAYKYSRNPIYLGFTFLYIGILLFYKTFLLFITLPIILIYIRTIVIRKEERYLERVFGDSYIKYKKSVNRWM